MAILFIVLGIILMVIGCTIVEEAPICIGGVLFLAGVFMGAASVCDLIDARDVDDRIAMYEEQNAEIESQVETAVKLYMSHEDEVFDSASPESYITLVSLYPELKSDALIQKQIELYTDNNEKICELKEEKITAQRSKFWLYFGK